MFDLRRNSTLASLLWTTSLLSCSGASAPSPSEQAGSSSSTGGAPAGGGQVSTAGGNTATGGLAAVGGQSGEGGSGAAGSSGAFSATGGAPAGGTGGAGLSAGGPAGGGSPATGGAQSIAGGPSAGGRPANGGAPATGGSAGNGGSNSYAPCAAGTACVILPLGDSITEGCCTAPEGGYRIQLFTQAVNNKQNITFVGGTLGIGNAAPNGPTTVAGQPFPKGNEGNGGYTIASPSSKGGIAGAITDQSCSMYKPNIVLLMIGTNDILQNIDLAKAPTRLASLVDEIITDAPNALLVVSSIPPCCNDATVQSYNASIPDIVKTRAQAGKHILFVDAHAAYVQNTNYKNDYISSDGLHPSSKGYAVIGDLFYGAIKGVLP